MTVTSIDIPSELRDVDRAVSLVELYFQTDDGKARYSGAWFERLGGGGDRPEVACCFTPEDLLAVSMLSVRISGYHALHVLEYRADELNGLLALIPADLALTDPRAGNLIAEGSAANTLWRLVRDIRPRPSGKRMGPVAAGKLLARKRPHLIPVYDSRVKRVLNRPSDDRWWWRDLHAQLTADPGLVHLLETVRASAGVGYLSLLRTFDVMCWMYSWNAER